jgi:PKD repeat protein
MIGVRDKVPEPIVPLNTAYCKGTNVIVNVQNPTFNYNWYDYMMNFLHSGSSHSVTDIQTAQKVYVEALDINNCASVFDTVRIYVDSIKARFIASSDSIVVGDFIQYTSQNHSVAAVAWNWNFFDGDGSALENPYHYYNTTGRKDVFLEVTSSNGCVDSMLANGIVTVYTKPNSINEISAVNAIKIYPNPASEVIYLDLLKASEAYEVSVMDIAGKVLFTENINGRTKQILDFGGYADGVYMIKIVTADGVKIGKIIKKS